MNWGSFIVKTLGLLVVLALVLFYAYGNYVLIDSVVPAEGYEVGEWLNSYYTSGIASLVIGFICSAVWFFCGLNYTGGNGINVYYYGLLFISFVLSVVINFVLLIPAIEGSGLAGLFVVISAPVLYYLASIFAYAPAVKYIPAGAEFIHK